ncbi:Na+/H+ antiporter NhaA [Thermostaphylospora chromogena]|uniref:Na(+)/H(+) antiporter NhaA n=1 Tax=Thermostaphylospora chromogena TaxID=35622 RepID=A0A1H1H936_9ACTN|nr:Na+/H+ antiporter NhaA [Thermostaphylospora chromogena]SDR21893.1 sodium/proton antiporter, NhaA family [Thermostaphylospora chromogena]
MSNPAPTRKPVLLSRGSWREVRRIGAILRKETVGGALLLFGAAVAMVWANSPWGDAYEALRGIRVGPEALHLNLTLGAWAADGLLAIFFFVAGLELKREFVAGDLRDIRRSAVPVVAALGGVMVPALLYLLITRGVDGAARGWAIPTATDIAFALAVLAVIGRFLPTALRTFLLTLAVVDDLVAIVIIALFYTETLAPVPLLGALVPLALFTVLVQRRVRSWWLLLPLAVATWALMHASGVHATVAGVLLGFAVPVLRDRKADDADDEDAPCLAEHFEHRFRPLSAGVAVPVFAFMSAGVALGGLDGVVSAYHDPVVLGVVAGLVAGKPIGIMTATWLMARFTHADLDENLAWVDMLGLSMLAGIGFTVSLLVGELAFGVGNDEHVKVAVLASSVIAALLAAVILRLRNRVYRRIHEIENADLDRDGVPDVYEADRPEKLGG